MMQKCPRIPVQMPFGELFQAYQKARRGKKPSSNQLRFCSRWLGGLQNLHQDLRAGSWQPHRTVSFVVKHPKTREIHAPDFADRVVHHWLVAQLERIYEPIFIFDSYANRSGKGSHAAVDRLERFMRQLSQGNKKEKNNAWFLQLDIHNFFNSISRAKLYALLKCRLEKSTKRGQINAQHALALQSLCHRLLAKPAAEHCTNPKAAALVPPHKRLRNAKRGCGLPIGNLSSQFFANVVLNELDQFIKHTLKVEHYVRYVDDFVLLSHDRDQLRVWQVQIEVFLQNMLGLKIKNERHLAPLSQGIDFLGYIVFPTHRLVRRRVVKHCKAALQAWQNQHVKQHDQHRTGMLQIQASSLRLAALEQQLQSYWGHFAHAHCWRLLQGIFTQFAWLGTLFDWQADGQLRKRWVIEGSNWREQLAWLVKNWPHAEHFVQKGYETYHLPRPAATQAPEQQTAQLHAIQTGYLRHGLRRREINRWCVPVPNNVNPSL